MLGNGASIGYVIPETILAALVGLVMVFGAFQRTRNRAVIAGLGVLGFGAALVATLAVPAPSTALALFWGNLTADGLTWVFRPIFLLTGLLAIVFAYTSDEIDSRDFADTTILVASSVLGMCLMAAASDLLMFYLAMEFVGILSYVLAGLRREDQRSSEAALKYVIYGGAASGVMLFGLSLLYGIAGDTSIAVVRAALLRDGSLAPLTLTATVMVLAGLAYKVAAVPFHMWCPDVYQGAPTPITAFFSVGPKAAGFALMLRLIASLVGGTAPGIVSDGLMLLIGIVSVVTMTLGNLAALNQTSVKRMLAYSSIAHAGYLLMGVATLTALTGSNPDYVGFQAVFFYLVIYLFMNLGAFFVVSVVVSRVGSDDRSAFRNLGRRAPFMAAVLTLFLLALTGIPPTAGFAGKFYLFYAVLQQAAPPTEWARFFLGLALIGVLNSFVSLFYYARILKVMYLDKSADDRPVTVGALATVILLVLAIPTLFFGLYFGPIVEMASILK